MSQQLARGCRAGMSALTGSVPGPRFGEIDRARSTAEEAIGNSLRNGTGNFLERTGNFFQRTGNTQKPEERISTSDQFFDPTGLDASHPQRSYRFCAFRNLVTVVNTYPVAPVRFKSRVF